MNFIELTSHYNGEKIAINLKYISTIYPWCQKLSDVGMKSIGTHIGMVSGDKYWIEETYEQVISLIDNNVGMNMTFPRNPYFYEYTGHESRNITGILNKYKLIKSIYPLDITVKYTVKGINMNVYEVDENGVPKKKTENSIEVSFLLSSTIDFEHPKHSIHITISTVIIFFIINLYSFIIFLNSLGVWVSNKISFFNSG